MIMKTNDNNLNTKIQVSKITRDKLAKRGGFDDTMEDIICRLLDEVER